MIQWQSVSHADQAVVFMCGMAADQTVEESERTKQFSLEVVDLLKHSPQCRMPFNKFIPSYHHHFGRQCRVSDYGFTKLLELLEAIPHILKVIEKRRGVLCLADPQLMLGSVMCMYAGNL